MEKQNKLLNLNQKGNFCLLVLFSLLFSLMGIFLLPNAAFLSSVSEDKIIELTNNERLKYNLNTLKLSPLLSKAAQQKAIDIFAAQQFQHNINDKKFSSWIKEAGYKYFYAGENLAINFVTSEGVVKAWLQSPTHKNNLLSENFREVGVAVVEGKYENNYTTIIVQIFGSPLSSAISKNNINTGQSGFLVKNALNDKNIFYTKQKNTFLARANQSVSHPENLLTHSTASNLNNLLIQQGGSQFQTLNNYKLLKNFFNKISSDQPIAWKKINNFNNNMPAYYILLIITSLAVILLELFLKTTDLKNKKIN